MIDKMALTDLSNYQTDFLMFKNEVLKLINKSEENQKTKENEAKSRYEELSKKQEQQMSNFSERIAELSNVRTIEKSKIDKLEDIALKQVKIEEEVNINSIRIVTCQKDISNALYKYDKIFLDNLMVPGVVGEYCKYKNLKEYINFTLDQFSNLNQTKDRDQASLQCYKENIDIMIKQFSFRFDTFLKTSFGYTNESVSECVNNSKRAIEEVYDKMETLRIENNKHALTLKAKSDEFSKDLDAIRQIKVEIMNKMTLTMSMIETRNEEIIEKFSIMNNTFDNINQWCLQTSSEVAKHKNHIEDLYKIIDSMQNDVGDKDISSQSPVQLGNSNYDLNRIDDEVLRLKIKEIVKECVLNDEELNNTHDKRRGSNKYVKQDVESSLKKYIKGEISSTEFSPNHTKGKSNFASLLRKQTSLSPKSQDGFLLRIGKLPESKLEEQESNNQQQNDMETSSNGNDLLNSIDPNLKKDNYVKENRKSCKSNNKTLTQVSSALPLQNIKIIESNEAFKESKHRNNKKKLSIGIISKDNIIPELKSTDNLSDDKEYLLSNINNWKINEIMKKKKIIEKEEKANTDRGNNKSKDITDKIKEKPKDNDKVQSKTKDSDVSKAKLKEMNKFKDKLKDLTITKDRLRDIEKKRDKYKEIDNCKEKSKDIKLKNNDIRTEREPLKIREYGYIKENDIMTDKEKDGSKDKEQERSSSICRDIYNNTQIKTLYSKEQELSGIPSHIFNRREASQETTTVNFHYPQIESASTPLHINTSRSEAKYFFNKQQKKCLSAKREESNYDFLSMKCQSVSDNLLAKLPNNKIEKRLIEIEYFIKKKFDELVSELQRYIPLNFKSHTRYFMHDIDENILNRTKVKNPNETEYQNDFKKTKISIATSEVIEQTNRNDVYRSLFPKKVSSNNNQAAEKKGTSSFRKLQQTSKEKKPLTKPPGITNNINTTNAKEMNISEGSSYVAVSKLITNMPKTTVDLDENHKVFSFGLNAKV